MFPDMALWLKVLLSALVAFGVSFLLTPPVKRFAELVGAIDVPKDGRRMHDHPIPRMGGLAIFLGFVLAVVLFVPLTRPITGILLGALIIAIMGAIDDILCLNPWVKLLGQVVAAAVAIRCGVVFDTIPTSSPSPRGRSGRSAGWPSP